MLPGVFSEADLPARVLRVSVLSRARHSTQAEHAIVCHRGAGLGCANAKV